MQAEWSQHPPVHQLVAAYLGYKGEARGRFRPNGDNADAATLESVLEEFGQVVGGNITKVKAPE